MESTSLITPQELNAQADSLTPWEPVEGWWVKRDDTFAPLGYGGVNGSKLRQPAWLFDRRGRGAERVLTWASALSPQHCMTAVVAAIYGLTSVHVTAAAPERHESTRIAKAFGANFFPIAVGYNPAVQAAVREIERQYRASAEKVFVVPYGITTEDPDEVQSFHLVGARQVQNIPDDVEELWVPLGSGNSLTSIILGLSTMPTRVRRLVTPAIGPDRVGWVCGRMKMMGIDPDRLPFEWDNGHSLHGSGYASYGDRMAEAWGGIALHPTYEGKVYRWIRDHQALTPRPGQEYRRGFWIVGSEPSLKAMYQYVP